MDEAGELVRGEIDRMQRGVEPIENRLDGTEIVDEAGIETGFARVLSRSDAPRVQVKGDRIFEPGEGSIVEKPAATARLRSGAVRTCTGRRDCR